MMYHILRGIPSPLFPVVEKCKMGGIFRKKKHILIASDSLEDDKM
jgi:hypothetical protein